MLVLTLERGQSGFVSGKSESDPGLAANPNEELAKGAGWEAGGLETSLCCLLVCEPSLEPGVPHL